MDTLPRTDGTTDTPTDHHLPLGAGPSGVPKNGQGTDRRDSSAVASPSVQSDASRAMAPMRRQDSSSSSARGTGGGSGVVGDLGSRASTRGSATGDSGAGVPGEWGGGEGARALSSEGKDDGEVCTGMV